jgi:hypothetical protein
MASKVAPFPLLLDPGAVVLERVGVPPAVLVQ